MESLMERVPKVKRTFYTAVGKRLLDIALSGMAIVVLIPIFALLSLLELTFHGRPVLFVQERAGLHGKPFKLYKFRSMTNETDESGRLLPEKWRVTRFGKFIRRFSLDELPGLFCVLKGDMSIVGPRPLLVEYLPRYSKRHGMRHAVKPGLACVPLKHAKASTWEEQFENDVWYVENCCLWVDVRMVIAIAREAILGSEHRTEGNRGGFMGEYLHSDMRGGGNLKR